jgi:hypothetical protein
MACLPREGDRRQEAWNGAGPGILLGLSLTASVALSTIVVLTFRGWLNDNVSVPPVYGMFSGAFTLVLCALVGIVILYTLFVTLPRLKKPMMLPATVDKKELTDGNKVIVRAHHVVALAHRAEWIVGSLSVLGMVALGLAVYLTFGTPRWVAESHVAWVMGKADWVTGLVGVALIGAFVGGGMLANSRPLGLLWDLMCFLPRTAHPFAPPCYAERAVPELADYTHEWLAGDDERVVVLSAHSLGGVLAVATIYALPKVDVERIKLLTYGVQLRTYFGRIFPELLGPRVLGTPPARAARLFALDPWAPKNNSSTTTSGGDTLPADSLRKLMDDPGAGSADRTTLRWINLWRRTDYLGFPMYDWRQDGNPLDQPADETNGAGEIQTHSDYHLTRQYREALEKFSSGRPAAKGRPKPRRGCGIHHRRQRILRAGRTRLHRTHLPTHQRTG